MPANGFNVGRDVTLDIVDPVQGALRFKIKTAWKVDQKTKDLESHGLDGNDRFAHLPGGWQISFTFDRADSSIDDYFATQEVNYFAGVTLGNVSITETITNPNGVITQYRYTNVALKLTDGGDWKGDQITKQSISGMASRRLKVL
jgi:hypothetical protein